MVVDWNEHRPSLTPEIAGALRDRFGLRALETPRDLGGAFTLNLLVVTSDGRYVARVHGSQTSAARLAAIQHVRQCLGAGGVPSPENVPAGDGAPFVTVGGQLLEVERYVEHDANMDTWHRLEVGLPCLGRTHSLLRSVRVGAAGRRPLFANHIEPQHALRRTHRSAQRLRSWLTAADDLELLSSFEDLAYLVDEAERGVTPALPRQLVHGDFWDNNVLFRDGKVVLVTDLDFMGERLRIDDLALTLYFANTTIGGDLLSGERIRQLRRLVDVYDSGLTDPLSTAERRAIPAAIARNTLWSIGRWALLAPTAEEAWAQVSYRSVEVKWTLGLMRDLTHWQEALAA
jgi:Ser/Thr protein kinase RdoA (MazF antagonist)